MLPQAEAIVKKVSPEHKVIIVTSGNDIKLLGNDKIRATGYDYDKNGTPIPNNWEGKPDFYIFDLRMPGESGIKIWERLGKPENYVVLSLWAEELFWRDKMDEAGMDLDRAIKKKVDINEVYEKIEPYISAIIKRENTN